MNLKQIAGGGVIAAALVVAVASGSSSTSSESSAPADAGASQATEQSASPVPAEEGAAAAGVGTPVRDGKFEFTVTDVQTDVAQVGPELLEQKAQGAYTLVTLTVANIGDEAQTFDANNVTGTDSQGREVKSDGTASLYANEGSQSFLEEINPGNSISAVVVFDLPAGESLASIKVQDSMFSNGATINLT